MGKSEPPSKLEPGRYLLLEGVQDPGNVGTILRTADAFDVDGVFLLEGCADLYSPKTVRAAMGVHFRRVIWRCPLEHAAALVKAAGLPLYGAALREDTQDVRQMDLSRAAVVIGQRGPGPLPGGPGGLYGHRKDPHEPPVRVAERVGRRRGPPVGDGAAELKNAGPQARILGKVSCAPQIPGRFPAPSFR